MSVIPEQISDYVKEVAAAKAKEWAMYKFDMTKVPTFDVEMGKRFAKIVVTSWGQKSVHCFVEISTGDLYKAATWSAPAKGVRGNIANAKKPLLCGDFYIK